VKGYAEMEGMARGTEGAEGNWKVVLFVVFSM